MQPGAWCCASPIPPLSWNLSQAPCGCRSYVHRSWRESRKPFFDEVYALSLTGGELTAGRWNCPNRSWWGVGAGERRGIMKLTGDLSVSSIYRSHFISTCNIKWETDWNTEEKWRHATWNNQQSCHLETAQFICIPKVMRKGHGGRPDTRFQFRGWWDPVRETDCSLLFISLPQMARLPRECLQSEIIDFHLK